MSVGDMKKMMSVRLLVLLLRPSGGHRSMALEPTLKVCTVGAMYWQEQV